MAEIGSRHDARDAHDARDEMNKKQALYLVETAASITWFAMDACWMLGARIAATTLAVPTVLLGILAFRYAARTAASFFVTGAMAAWACMNVLWMGQDLQFVAWGLAAGKAFLVLGVALLALALVFGRAEALRLVLRRFRRLRLGA